MPVLRWSATTLRKLEAARDQIMHGAGTDERWIVEEMSGPWAAKAVAIHWRKPLRIDEINLMAPTEEVRARAGRP